MKIGTSGVDAFRDAICVPVDTAFIYFLPQEIDDEELASRIEEKNG
jgi:hypothetical protein